MSSELLFSSEAAGLVFADRKCSERIKRYKESKAEVCQIELVYKLLPLAKY